MKLNTTVAPFILRGVSLLGVDSGYIREPYRSGVWQRLAPTCARRIWPRCRAG
jgi:hypothetical protein